jgi:hypothetical protein
LYKISSTHPGRFQLTKPSQLLGIAHGLIYFILYYAAGTWLEGSLQEKHLRQLIVLSNSTLQIVFERRRDGYAALWNCTV